jgi:glutamate formiminotransferase/formiminotetrahydrofolate cyclodeaminase
MSADARKGDVPDSLRHDLIAAATAAYEDAGLSGLCVEGRWEAALDAMRRVDVETRDPMRDLSRSVSRIVSAVGGASAAPPGGGSVAASAGALAAALTQMVAGLTTGRPRYAHVDAEMRRAADRASTLAAELTDLVRRDGAAFDAVSAAYKLPKETTEAAAVRAAAIERAMVPATRSPFEIARAAADVAELAAVVAERGNRNAVADAAVAAVLAEAACRAAALTVRVNAPALSDANAATALVEEAVAHSDRATNATARAVAAVDGTRQT